MPEIREHTIEPQNTQDLVQQHCHPKYILLSRFPAFSTPGSSERTVGKPREERVGRSVHGSLCSLFISSPIPVASSIRVGTWPLANSNSGFILFTSVIVTHGHDAGLDSWCGLSLLWLPRVSQPRISLSVCVLGSSPYSTTDMFFLNFVAGKDMIKQFIVGYKF